MTEQLQSFLTTGTHSTLMLFVGIVALSYLLEDLAIVTAAGLASQQLTSYPVAILAIFVGIASGDLGLYYLGKWSRRVRSLRYRAVTNRHFRHLKGRLSRHAFSNLFVIRFVPGLRTVGYTLSGFFAIPAGLFLSAVLLATAVWTLLVFSVVYWLGVSVWQQTSAYQWLLIPLAFSGLVFVNRFLNKTLTRGIS